MISFRTYLQLLPFKGNEWTSCAVKSISVTCVQHNRRQRAEPPIPKRWSVYNEKVYPPQGMEEARRPAYVCHMKTNFKYSPWKLWYISKFVKGMSVDEALRQLDYIKKKGAAAVKDTILEAQELAVTKHNVEFRSNLWIAESFVGKGLVIKGIRRHARKKIGIIEYFHCHYFVRLEEGPPPLDMEQMQPDGPTLLQTWIQNRRDLNIGSTL